jgi:hypothetical protein
MEPSPKRTKDLQMRRVRFVCSGSGTHTSWFLFEYGNPSHPGRPDLEMMPMTKGSATAHCEKCNRPMPKMSEEELRSIVATTEPGRVLLYDISTERLIS